MIFENFFYFLFASIVKQKSYLCARYIVT